MVTTVVFLAAVTLAVWWPLWRRWESGAGWVPYEPRQEVPWGLVDLALVLILLVTSTVAAAALMLGVVSAAAHDLVLDERAVWVQSAQWLAVVAAVILVLGLRYGVAAQELGFVASRWRYDVRLGVRAFLALAPPTYLLQALLSQFVESKHPLMELLRRQPQPSLIAATCVTAVLVAPLTEEFLFRGLLQGWLERYAAAGGRGRALVWGGRPQTAVADQAKAVPGVQPEEHTPWDAALLRSAAAEPAAPAYWPMAASASIFALLHISHGPDWIPLFFFGLGLGYLYRQTHRIVPAIVVHFLLNGCSMLLLLQEIFLAGHRG